MTNDLVSDMLTRIRNASLARINEPVSTNRHKYRRNDLWSILYIINIKVFIKT